MDPETSHFDCLRSFWRLELEGVAVPLVGASKLDTHDIAHCLSTKTLAPLVDELSGQPRLKDGLFVRVGGFSFKEHPVFDLLGGGRVASVTDARTLCTTLPRRIGWSLAIHQKHGRPVDIEFLPWMSIPSWTEIRLFIIKRQFAGAMQMYRHRGEVFPEAHVQMASQAVMKWFKDFSESLPTLDLAIDLYLNDTGGLTLLELNPLFKNRTDLGPFTFDELGAHCGEFRWIRAANSVGRQYCTLG